MSYQRQPELNGGYYGPPIPPPQRYSRPKRGGGRGCCGSCGCCLLDCLCDCGCCILSCIFKIICSIIVFIALIVLVFWLIVRPHEVKFHATDASLTTFNLSSAATGGTAGTGSQLSYNLAVNFTVRNPNKHIGVYYDQIEANAIYAGQRFSTVEGQKFFQGTKNTTSFGPIVFKGDNKMIMVGSDGRDEYEKQSKVLKFDIQVKLYLRVRFKLGWFKTATFKPKVKCDLKVPLHKDGQSEMFETTRCHYTY